MIVVIVVVVAGVRANAKMHVADMRADADAVGKNRRAHQSQRHNGSEYDLHGIPSLWAPKGKAHHKGQRLARAMYPSDEAFEGRFVPFAAEIFIQRIAEQIVGGRRMGEKRHGGVEFAIVGKAENIADRTILQG